MDDLDIIDGHVHCYRREAFDQLLADIRYTGAKRFNVLVTDRDDNDEQWNNGRWLKEQFPGEGTLFGGLKFKDSDAESFKRQLQQLMEAGCDGLKLLVGKPDRRRDFGHPLDSPVLAPMLRLAEERQFPVLWHVGDPPEFFSKQTVPLWAKQRGWWHVGTPGKAQIEAEIANVFARHPKLNLILPHLFFLSDRLEDAADLLETYPSFMLDLAPGVELYHNLTARHEQARDFFIRFADRIIFGTDFGLPFGWSRDRGMMVRRFLETTDVFDVPNDPAMTPDERPALRGLGLPREALRRIYAENFRRVLGRYREAVSS